MDLQNNQKLTLHREDRFVFSGNHSSDVYIVLSGVVTIFIVPLKENGEPGKRVRIGEAGADFAIPGFYYRDDEGTTWSFLLTAQEDAQLELLPGARTDFVEENFFAETGIPAYDIEGFERGLLDYYYANDSLKGGIFISESGNNAPEVQNEARKVIWKAFSGEEQFTARNPLYAAVAFACQAASIPIAEESCFAGRDLTVQEIARLSRFACREVVLEPNWYRSDCGAIIGFMAGDPVACVPRGQTGYKLYNGRTGEIVRITKKLAREVEPRAFSIARTLPGRSLKFKDLIKFTMGSVRGADVAAVVVLGLIGVLIGILLPTLNQKIYDEYIPLGNYGQLVQLCVVIASFMVGSLFFDIVKRLTDFRIASRVGYGVQTAAFYRVFHLPETFFRDYDSADLAQRLSYVDDLANKIVTTIFVSGLSTVFSLMYLFRMFKYSSKLSWIAILMIVLYAGLCLVFSASSIKHDRKIQEDRGEASGRLYQFLSGIEKIRMAGAEDRAAFEYLKPFSDQQMVEIRRNRLISVSETISIVADVLFAMVFYFIIARGKMNITTGNFMAFNSAFGSFSAALLEFIEGGLGIWELRSQYDRFRPIVESPQEDDENCELPGKLEGRIRLSDVCFSYEKEGPNVLDGINLDIHPGEYVGIVGASGCGKSTLLKLLLGFERPKTGQVLYDEKNINTLDKRELRKNLGVVLQNGKLISGSIFENITITAPHATMKEVSEVIEAVGLKEDIEQMPMGIQTVLSENSSTISGGQQQRILIARAIISNPAILIFDEATSALDNLTQAAVCESLDKMNVTRIVVAHRLSTIRKCDRIIVLDAGKIAEEGNYEELMAKRGRFYDLAARQIVEEM